MIAIAQPTVPHLPLLSSLPLHFLALSMRDYLCKNVSWFSWLSLAAFWLCCKVGCPDWFRSCRGSLRWDWDRPGPWFQRYQRNRWTQTTGRRLQGHTSRWRFRLRLKRGRSRGELLRDTLSWILQVGCRASIAERGVHSRIQSPESAIDGGMWTEKCRQLISLIESSGPRTTTQNELWNWVHSFEKA